MRTALEVTRSIFILIVCLITSAAIAGECGVSTPCAKRLGVNYVEGHCAPFIKRSHAAPWLKSACEASYRRSCGEAPYLKTSGAASYRKSCGEASFIRTRGQASFVKGCGLAPIIKSVCEPPCYPPEQKEPTPLCVISNSCPSK